MNQDQARTIIASTFSQPFQKERFVHFVSELLNQYEGKDNHWSGQYIKEAYKPFISAYHRIGTYTDPLGEKLDILVVSLKTLNNLEYARSMQRNFVAEHLVQHDFKEAALVAFVCTQDPSEWRFSFVRMDYRTQKNARGIIEIVKELTPARRYSYLVGESEPCHTAQAQLLPLLADTAHNPTLKQIEDAFAIEKVTSDFFTEYHDLFVSLKEELDELVRKDNYAKKVFSASVDTTGFAKKLLGQIVFLYFLQKKGWLGVAQGAAWGSGPKDFLHRLFAKEIVQYEYFFQDILEPLFYEALAIEREGSYFPTLNCLVPFLNGGLFEPIGGYHWREHPIKLKNTTFKDIFAIFDRYNFTVREDEPLEQEVAVDPEMLGKVFEKLLEVDDRKLTGAFYTPREIVHYMCQESLIQYLDTTLNRRRQAFIPVKAVQESLLHPPQEKQIPIKTEIYDSEIPINDIRFFIEHGETTVELETVKEIGMNKGKGHTLPESIRSHAFEIDQALANIRVCDPAVGSGAFPVGMLTEIVRARMVLTPFMLQKVQPSRTAYALKRHAIEASIYGVDIEPSAIDIARLRLWLSLVVDEDDFTTIKPLPNLDYKFVVGDSLQRAISLFNHPLLSELEEAKQQLFDEVRPAEKERIRSTITKLVRQLTNNQTRFDFRVFFSEVFSGDQGGFDVVIGNPPYVSTRNVLQSSKKELEEVFGFSDDLYNHFYFRAFDIARPNGVVAYISSNTFYTIQTKENLRQLLLGKHLLEVFYTGRPFDAMVDTTVVIALNRDEPEDYPMVFKDGRANFRSPVLYPLNASLYREAARKVIFIPNSKNMKIYDKYNLSVKELIFTKWNMIRTSKAISESSKHLIQERSKLRPGDVTLFGILTDGGVGLQTGNNGRFVGVRAGTKQADAIYDSRVKKLWELIDDKRPKSLSHLTNKREVSKYLASMTEPEIWALFDALKDKYGRDVFGQGYIFRIVPPGLQADVDSLTDSEKRNGIDPAKPYFVPYEKGDKDGNRWYLKTPFVIDWSKASVKFLYGNSGKKGEGMPVVRNPQFYFRAGFCWTDVNSTYLKARVKTSSVFDVLSMSLYSEYADIPDFFFVFLINSKFIGEYVQGFINNTPHFQINDARQIPVVIPTPEILARIEAVFQQAYLIQTRLFAGDLKQNEAEALLAPIQTQVDQLTLELYGLAE